MTKLSELNGRYGTDWKQGDVVKFPNGCDVSRYVLTGRTRNAHLVAIPLGVDYLSKRFRVYLHPTSVKRVGKGES